MAKKTWCGDSDGGNELARNVHCLLCLVYCGTLILLCIGKCWLSEDFVIFYEFGPLLSMHGNCQVSAPKIQFDNGFFTICLIAALL